MEIAELKSYLRITWSDEDGELTKIIERGKAYLDEISGVKLDYSNDFHANQLLLDYGRYVYNHSFELFEVNFANELLRLTLREGLKSFEETDTETTP